MASRARDGARFARARGTPIDAGPSETNPWSGRAVPHPKGARRWPAPPAGAAKCTLSRRTQQVRERAGGRDRGIATQQPPIRAGRPAVFLDRDDTLVACTGVAPDGDLGDPDLVRLLPGAAETCAALAAAGYALVVVTNQGGVARGRYGLDAVAAVHERLDELLGGRIAAFRACPWHPEGTVPRFTREHPWRKPAPGMLLDAAAELGIDLAASWTIGDAVRDCEAGRAAGTRTILLRAGSPSAAPEHPAVDHVAASIVEAGDLVLAGSPAR